VRTRGRPVEEAAPPGWAPGAAGGGSAAGPDVAATPGAAGSGAGPDVAATPGAAGGASAGPEATAGGTAGGGGSFDHLAARYDRISTLLGAELRAWLLFHLPARGDRALDLGCGTGGQTVLLADRYAEVLAVDLSGPMVEFARRRRPGPNVRYEQRDLRDVTPDTDGRFDLVFSAYTLHHVDLHSALLRIRSLVRPGGQALLVDAVDDRPAVPRPWLRRQAWRTFGIDLRHRRRPLREAVELLRLQLDPDWLDHQTGDRLRSAADWDAHCRAVLPGATITPLHRARALDWRRDPVRR
jgi:SAM-dependent methyltransferase